MPYLIDGHNLIPKLGLRLDSVDDEMELVAILQEFARLERRRQVEVYFDGAPVGSSGTRSLGTVKAHFVPLGQTADHAIRARLRKLGNDAKNWTVVSSDRQVQSDARSLRAQVISSEEYVGMLRSAGESAPNPAGERKLSSKEVDEWLTIFNDRRRKPEG
jgi:predicted RNA-binding protein with PIN domain